ncbi:protein DpdD [Gordonia bronchialis]|uniref:protein DpdD n=1 Tax=Gordonia bronchialis TaxID=2054 RepID=UPI002270E833|nr:protein DpdD [Gordonia bronchialis]
MRADKAVAALTGDLSRFGDLAERVEGLVDTQLSRFRPGVGEWLILPWSNGFCLFSENSEGQRRGREVVQAFLGPSVALVETIDSEHLDQSLPAAWQATGLVKASFLRRVTQSPDEDRDMLARMEDLVSSVGGRTTAALGLKPSPSDLLRDFRLALIGLDDESARAFLDQILLTGHVSAENARYLRIEYLAAFGRWTEMRAMPHIGALLKSRRPRAISETLLRMVWWSELAGPAHGRPQQAFLDRNVLGTYGALLRSVRVPSTAEGRSVVFLAATAEGDETWQREVLERAASSDERAVLQGLARDDQTSTPPQPTVPEPNDSPTVDPVGEAFRAGRFAEVIRVFLSNPVPEYAELALQAILDSGELEHATEAMRLVQDLTDHGKLELSRRGRRDLEELQQQLAGSCSGWLEWASRLGAPTRWADGAAILRNERQAWEPLASIGAQPLAALCDSLLEASGTPNEDQLRTCLDVLCSEAADLLAQGQSNDFCQVVLALLSEQENFSEMVRNAYLGLIAAWLAAGPTAKEYDEVLDQTLAIWREISSPNAVDWAINILESIVDSPCPDESKRAATAVLMIEDVRQQTRLTLRQRVEVEGLAADFGLPTRVIETPQEERDVWAALDGKFVGIYSLLTRAESYLTERLSRLCAVGDVKGNSDQVATQALRSLAEKADYLVVDTWHAAHQATGAIDAVRPRERQILPKQKGHSGFLRALEEAIGG